MSNFQSITLNRSDAFFRAISEVRAFDLSIIRQRYFLAADKFEEILRFVISMNLVEVSNDKLKIMPNMREFISSYEQLDNSFRTDFILDSLLSMNNDAGSEIQEFFNQFELVKNRYESRLSASNRLKYSDLRNLLMELNLLEADNTTKTYIIDKKYLVDYFESKCENETISLEELKTILALRAEIGDAAEEAIVRYEKNRLAAYPKISEKVMRISKDNIAAGYDVLSFEVPSGDTSSPIYRYIEVKAVNRFNMRFYWSRNEIAAASKYGDSFFLYLLPVAGKGKFYFTELQLIPNPYINIYKNSQTWKQECEVIKFSKIPQ